MLGGRGHAIELSNWANAFRLVLLVQLFSASAERVFLILQFTAQQQSSLEDYLELSVMLQFSLIAKRNSKMGGRLSKMGEPEKQNGKLIEHKSKAK